jgi:thiol-disulfide isomerase/thioredoxin
MKKYKPLIIGLVIFGSIVGLLAYQGSKPGKYDEFAGCIAESGAKMYAAFWCPHCQEQKAMFGRSANKLPYVECSQPDRKQNQICEDNNITSYPTWIFADGTRRSGRLNFEQLAQATNCSLEEGNSLNDTRIEILETEEVTTVE